MSTIACAAILASCGESDEPEPSIPAGTGDQIVAALDNVRGLVEDGDCDQAETVALDVRNAISGLPADVPDDLEQALVRGSDNLIQQIPDQCEPREEKEPPEEEEPITGATGEEGVVP